MQPIVFRSATLEDLPVLYEFEQGIITAERPFDPTLKSGHINYYDLKALIESDTAEVHVAACDGEVVGSGYAQIQIPREYLKHDKFSYLGFMFVRPDYRGRGVITQLLDKLKQWSLDNGVTELRLDVYSDNAPAVAAYEKAGFTKHLVEMRMEIGTDKG